MEARLDDVDDTGDLAFACCWTWPLHPLSSEMVFIHVNICDTASTSECHFSLRTSRCKTNQRKAARTFEGDNSHNYGDELEMTE